MEKILPNTNTWVKKFEALDRDENLNIACGKRTVMRDIDAFRKSWKGTVKWILAMHDPSSPFAEELVRQSIIL